MENELIMLFGQGTDLTTLQISLRTVVVFMVCLVLIRIAGRRSFGMRMAFDNVLLILLGAILSRAVVGASPFIPTIAAATVIAVLHRVAGLLAYYFKTFGKVIKGDSLKLYEHGKVNEKNMRYCMVTMNDLITNVRTIMHEDSFAGVDEIYMERDGQISIIKNKNYIPHQE